MRYRVRPKQTTHFSEKEISMKRFHVHVSVENVSASARFYSALFGREPSVIKSDYAKWMIDEPRINFAISDREGKPGLNHMGFQLDDEDELEQMRAQLELASLNVVPEPGTTCCYSQSEKYWIQDPTGIAWETFTSLASVPTFGATPKNPEALSEAQSPGRNNSRSCCLPSCCS